MNSTAAVEDEEWESAGLVLEHMKLAEPVIAKNKPAFIMPARLLNRSIVGEINFLQDAPGIVSHTSSLQDQGGSFGTAFSPAVVSGSNEPVDSALLNAIENPRERMHVLNLENVLLLFIKSSDRSMELPPEHNSFRRLLAYRIAQRFGLTHAVSDQINENGERGILIYRTSDTRIPNPLLIDLPPHSDSPLDQTPFGTVPSLSDTGVLANGLDAPPVAKKMIMMKRNPNRENDPKKENSKKEKQSAEDRERAYVEARARIFGAEAEAAAATAAAASTATTTTTTATLGNASPSSTTNVPMKKSNSDNKLEKAVRTSTPRATSASPPPTVVVSNTAQINSITNSNSSTSSSNSNSTNNATTRKKVVNSTKKGVNGTEGNASTSEKKVSPPPPPTHDNVTQPATATTTPHENTVNVVNTKKKTVDPTAWKERKFTERDFVAERSDPDFSRRSTATTSNLNNRAVQHGQFVQPVQFRPEDLSSGMLGYQQGVQGQGQNLGSMVPGNVPYQGYPISDPYQSAMYGQNAGMMPYLQNGHPYVQTSFMQMNHINPASPTQQQWQQVPTPGMMMNQHQGPFYPHRGNVGNMGPVHSPLGTVPLSIPMAMNMYGQVQGPLGIGPVPGNYPNGPYLGGLYPPVPIPIITGTNIPTGGNGNISYGNGNGNSNNGNNGSNSLSGEQQQHHHQNSPSV